MSKPVNLNRFRKHKARAEKKARADENAVKFGRDKTQKALDQKRSEKMRKHIDGHQSES